MIFGLWLKYIKKTLKDSKLKILKNLEKGSWVSIVNPNIDEFWFND